MKTKTTIKSLLRSVILSTFLTAAPLAVLFSCSGKSADSDEAYTEETRDDVAHDSISNWNDSAQGSNPNL